jgi:hypothetical protein
MTSTANLCVVRCSTQSSTLTHLDPSTRAYTNISSPRICQEILLSRRIMVHNTYAQVDWERFGAAVKRRPKKGKAVLDVYQGSNPEYFWNLRNDRRSIGHLQHRQNPGYHSIWSLLTTLFLSKCADQRDRIYSLLALVQKGQDFRVSYTETPVALFWRAGEHFGAWARPAFVSALRLALGVSLQELKDSLEEHAHFEITIPLRLFTSRSPLRMFASKAKCAHKACREQGKFQQPSKSRQDISFCSRTDADECRDIHCVHVLFHPVTNTRQSFELTLVAPAHNRYPGFTKRLDSVALQHVTGGEWQEVDNWGHVEQQMKRGRLVGRWRLALAPVVVVEHQNTMSERLPLIHDEVE